METVNIPMPNELNRINLCALPTPLIEAKNLSAYLKGPRIFIKRDDLLGLALGGNKLRALEYVMAQVKSGGHDVVVAIGPQQSNQLCCITAAARKCGMKVILLLLKGDNKIQGNLLLYHLLGAEIQLTDVDIADIADVENRMKSLIEGLRKQGYNPFGISYGALPLAGISGYIQLSREIIQQLAGLELKPRHLFVGCGSGLTQSGLILGCKKEASDCSVHGVKLDPRYSREQQEEKILNILKAAAGLLKTDMVVDEKDIECIDGYFENYGATERGLEAIKLVASTEGIFLDPTYTGKVMAALINQIKEGRLGPQDTVVFYHSGGIPAIFDQNDELMRQRTAAPEQ